MAKKPTKKSSSAGVKIRFGYRKPGKGAPKANQANAKRSNFFPRQKQDKQKG